MLATTSIVVTATVLLTAENYATTMQHMMCLLWKSEPPTNVFAAIAK